MVIIAITFIFGLILGVSEFVGLIKAIMENGWNMEAILPRIEGIAFAGADLALCFSGYHDAEELGNSDNEEDDIQPTI